MLVYAFDQGGATNCRRRGARPAGSGCAVRPLRWSPGRPLLARGCPDGGLRGPGACDGRDRGLPACRRPAGALLRPRRRCGHPGHDDPSCPGGPGARAGSRARRAHGLNVISGWIETGSCSWRPRSRACCSPFQPGNGFRGRHRRCPRGRLRVRENRAPGGRRAGSRRVGCRGNARRAHRGDPGGGRHARVAAARAADRGPGCRAWGVRRASGDPGDRHARHG